MNDNSASDVLISVDNVNQRFGIDDKPLSVLKNVNFSILRNSFTIIFGASGSGKSTLLNVLAGLQRPSTGKVLVQDQDLYAMKSDELAFFRANKVGFVHQTMHWIYGLNVLENISMPLFFLGYSKPAAVKSAMLSLDRVGMKDYANKQPILLSGGEQQRLGMARALANDPLFVIADEPTGNLDTDNGDKIMNLLLNAQTEFQRTIILVTHNMEYISLADHLLQIHDGVVNEVKSGDVKNVTDTLVQGVKFRINKLAGIKKDANHII